MAKPEPDIKSEAAAIAAQLRDGESRCRICIVAREHPRKFAVAKELMAQGVAQTKAMRWLADELKSPRLYQSFRGHLEKGHK